jgi:protein-S-isoprenylcysteine O-methyltransferase Ste14
MVLGFAETPERVELGLTPSFLLMRGPYALTRNPMYVSELGLWFGWAIFYGGVLVFIGFVLLWLGTNFIILPREERALEDHFGDAYREFRNRVPRWLRKTAGH